MSEIYVGPGYLARVDFADLPIVTPYQWTISRGYARTRIDGHTVYMHRMLLGSRPGFEVDHIDGDGLNNSRANLRWATKQQNAFNRNGRGGCSYLGVHRFRSSWRAMICLDGKNTHLGLYPTPEEAALAYNLAAKDHHGEFAHLNSI